MERKLTEKQKRFIDFYIETGNATEAAKRAGYKKKTAYQIGAFNLKKTQIKAAIQERLQKIDSRRIAKAKEVMEFLTAALRGNIKEEVVVVESLGSDIGSEAKIIKKQLSAHERLDAAKQLAKRYGLDTPVVENESETVTFIFDRRKADGSEHC